MAFLSAAVVPSITFRLSSAMTKVMEDKRAIELMSDGLNFMVILILQNRIYRSMYPISSSKNKLPFTAYPLKNGRFKQRKPTEILLLL